MAISQVTLTPEQELTYMEHIQHFLDQYCQLTPRINARSYLLQISKFSLEAQVGASSLSTYLCSCPRLNARPKHSSM